MTADDLAKLRSLAETATPGPWEGPLHQAPNGAPAVVRRVDRDEQDRRRITFLFEALATRGPAVSEEQALTNAAYIAALDPQTVLALLDAAALGLAWNRVEAALPEGASLKVRYQPWNGYTTVSAQPVDVPGPPHEIKATGPTPTAALLALADKLEAREP